jgi:hypothetical protein
MGNGISLGEWVGLLGAMGTWAAIVSGLLTYLHGRAAISRESLKEELMDHVKQQESIFNRDHYAMRQQIADITTAMRDTYVRREDFLDSVREFRAEVMDARKEIGSGLSEIQRRVDGLFNHTNRRPTN